MNWWLVLNVLRLHAHLVRLTDVPAEERFKNIAPLFPVRGSEKQMFTKMFR